MNNWCGTLDEMGTESLFGMIVRRHCFYCSFAAHGSLLSTHWGSNRDSCASAIPSISRCYIVPPVFGAAVSPEPCVVVPPFLTAHRVRPCMRLLLSHLSRTVSVVIRSLVNDSRVSGHAIYCMLQLSAVPSFIRMLVPPRLYAR